MIGNPTEVRLSNDFGLKARAEVESQVVLVRMCADGVKPVTERYRYPNALAGIVRIGQEEGMKAFYKGLGPNVIRSILMSRYIPHFGRDDELTLSRCLANRGIYCFERPIALK